MERYKYCVKIANVVIEEGIADLKTAKKAFKHGRNSYGNIIELNPDGTHLSEVAYKKIGGKLYSWK